MVSAVQLWRFEHADGTLCWSAARPPAWTPNMAAAVFVLEAPVEVAEAFSPAGLDTFRRQHGAPLHSVTWDPADPAVYKRNARVA